MCNKKCGWVLVLVSVSLAGLSRAGDPDAKRADLLKAKFVPATPPAANLPAPDPYAPVVERAFLYNHHVFDLKNGTFTLLLFDVPKALLFRIPATYVSEDQQHYFYYERRLNREWAFAKSPADNFANHAVWSRIRGSKDWQLESSEAVMASPWPPSE